jgi:hypothetical protein
VYFVDTNVGDITFTSWHADGLGKVSFKSHLPIAGFGEPVDDRPWVTAHNDGHVFYFGNEGNKNQYPLGKSGEEYGTGSGPGRYTVYSSYDGGATWDHLGISLKDSGWCRPGCGAELQVRLRDVHQRRRRRRRRAGDRRRTSPKNGTLYSYVSADDGKTFERYEMGTYNGADPWATYPTVAGREGRLAVGRVRQPRQAASAPKSGTVHAVPLDRPRQARGSKQDVTPHGGQLPLRLAQRRARTAPSVSRRTTARTRASPGGSTAPCSSLAQKPVLTSLDEKHPVADKAFLSPRRVTS